MGRDLFENFAAAREVFREADEALGFPLSQMCFEGESEALQLTENTQPAILTVSVAAFEAIKEAGISPPAIVAGHSLGEYSALVACRESLIDRCSTDRSSRGQIHAGSCTCWFRCNGCNSRR